MRRRLPTYTTERTTKFVLRGSFVAITLLSTLLILYNGIFLSIWSIGQTIAVIVIILYFLLAEFILYKSQERLVKYMLIVFYLCSAFITLLLYGLNAPVGILTISFAVLLPSILMSAKSIIPVAAVSITCLIVIEILHNTEIASPNLDKLSLAPTSMDVLTYSTGLSIFAFVSWMASSQREKNLERALTAEDQLRAQKNLLTIELDKESSALRLAQLNEVRHLHKFAVLGQTTAATLHELSNHLSILNLDIDDLGQQLSNSNAIENAKETIDHINKMVIQTRLQLNSYEHSESFNAARAIDQSAKDVSDKFKLHRVKLKKKLQTSSQHFKIHGNALTLTQIITILLNNALDASKEVSNPRVTLQTQYTKNMLYISVMDNGPGINPDLAKKLFNPIRSSKPNGLGVGLYIAKHLTEEQFKGILKLKPAVQGAHFVISIPRAKPAKAS